MHIVGRGVENWIVGQRLGWRRSQEFGILTDIGQLKARHEPALVAQVVPGQVVYFCEESGLGSLGHPMDAMASLESLAEPGNSY
jgi:hypothetical protein